VEVDYSENALKDRDYWKENGSDAIKDRIQKLINNIQETPFTGIGKPEPLKWNLSGKWSRRINDGNRIIYSCGCSTRNGLYPTLLYVRL
jgi:toxin YoeB